MPGAQPSPGEPLGADEVARRSMGPASWFGGPWQAFSTVTATKR